VPQAHELEHVRVRDWDPQSPQFRESLSPEPAAQVPSPEQEPKLPYEPHVQLEEHVRLRLCVPQFPHVPFWLLVAPAEHVPSPKQLP